MSVEPAGPPAGSSEPDDESDFQPACPDDAGNRDRVAASGASNDELDPPPQHPFPREPADDCNFNDQLLTLLPRLAAYLFCVRRRYGLTEGDADDVLQETCLKLLAARSRGPIANIRAYSFGALRTATITHHRKRARIPGQLSPDLPIPDHRALPADELAIEREEREKQEQYEAEALAWRHRFRRRLGLINRSLAERKRLKRKWAIFNRGNQPALRQTRGRPTPAQKLRRILDDALPKQIWWLLVYFMELEKGT